MQWGAGSSTANSPFYKVTFEPNPTRRHTRGKRGKQHEGVTDLQAEFDEFQRGQDWHQVRLGDVARTRAKQEKADLKRFSLHGFKGHDFPNLSGDERLEAMRAVANRNRVKSGTGGLSKAMKAFVVEENLAHIPKHPSQPWNRKTSVPKAAKTSGAKPFNLRSAVALFKRTGALPPVSSAVVIGLEAIGIDARALRRMIQLMLVREGVEENPGPPCKFNADFVFPRRERLKGHKTYYYTCPVCDTVLDRTRKDATGRMYHPDSANELAAYCDAPVAVDIPKVDLLDSCEAVTGDLPALAPTVNEAPSPAESPELPPRQVPLPGRVSSPVLPVPVPSPVVRPSSPRPFEAGDSSPPIRVQLAPPGPFDEPAVNEVRDDHALLGYRLTERHIKNVVSEVVGPHVQMSRFDHVVKLLEYGGERRLATARNVVELKKTMKVCQIRAVVRAYRVWPSVIAAVLAAVAAGGLTWVSPVLSVATITSTFVAISLYALFVMMYRRSRAVYISYVPHLVSAVLTEYDRGTNATAARATIRQKIRHLACLPIPDHSAAELIHGTEAVVMSLLSSEDFFSTEAACFGRQ